MLFTNAVMLEISIAVLKVKKYLMNSRKVHSSIQRSSHANMSRSGNSFSRPARNQSIIYS